MTWNSRSWSIWHFWCDFWYSVITCTYTALDTWIFYHFKKPDLRLLWNPLLYFNSAIKYLNLVCIHLSLNFICRLSTRISMSIGCVLQPFKNAFFHLFNTWVFISSFITFVDAQDEHRNRSQSFSHENGHLFWQQCGSFSFVFGVVQAHQTGNFLKFYFKEKHFALKKILLLKRILKYFSSEIDLTIVVCLKLVVTWKCPRMTTIEVFCISDFSLSQISRSL